MYRLFQVDFVALMYCEPRKREKVWEALTSRGVVEKDKPLPKCFEKHCRARS